MNKVVLVCKCVSYYSEYDEDAFFEWIKKIASVTEFKGVYDEIHLYMKDIDIPDDDLRELIGLFYRYKVNMKQLQIFLNDNNREWFEGKPKGYWYYRVFGKTAKKINK